MQFVKVLINKKVKDLDHDFIYEVPPEWMGTVQIGSVVSVPFGHRTEKGIVVGFAEPTEEYRIKYIDGILNEAFIFPEDLIVLADLLSRHYMTTTIGMLKAMIPRGINLFGKAQKPKTEPWLIFRENGKDISALRGEKQRALAALLKEKGEISFAYAAENGFSSAVCGGLIKNDFAEKENRGVQRYSYRHLPKKEVSVPKLTKEQHQALTAIRGRDPKDHRPILLHGVTGSGKTELYLRLTEDTLNKGKQVIVLLPEIALTPQFVSIFEQRFYGKVALFHSRLSDGERRDAWYAFRRGEARIALGARSCVFAPAENLGLIIMDEEHEESYEQDSSPRFHARVAASLRCRIHDADLVLGSATPSFESYEKALKGEYLLIALHHRVGGTPLPAITTVDMREELKAGWTEVLSRELIVAMEKTLSEGKQVMLFLNRLGYHTFVSCRDCGFVYRCPHCGVSLTYYQKENCLRCTRCDHREDHHDRCPQCGSHRIKYFGLGTDQLEEIVARRFPHAVIDRLDSDSTRLKGSVDEVFEGMKSGRTQILIGTRMLAKGWDFPDVALTGIIAADYTLNFPDFRSGEKTFQMIAQVAGRCGRGSEQGTVILQTYRPEEPALIFGGLQDYDTYYHLEAKNRRRFGYPPFTHLMKVIIVTPAEYLTSEELEKIKQCFMADVDENIRVFGPSPSVYRDKGKEKWILTFLGDKLFLLRDRINKGISQVESEKLIDKNSSIQIETEPIHSV